MFERHLVSRKIENMQTRYAVPGTGTKPKCNYIVSIRDIRAIRTIRVGAKLSFNH